VLVPLVANDECAHVAHVSSVLDDKLTPTQREYDESVPRPPNAQPPRQGLYSNVNYSYEKSGTDTNSLLSSKYGLHSETRQKDSVAEQQHSIVAIAARYHIYDYKRLQGMEDEEYHRIATQERVKEEKRGIPRKERRKRQRHSLPHVDAGSENYSYNRRGSPTYDDYDIPEALRDTKSPISEGAQPREYITEINIETQHRQPIEKEESEKNPALTIREALTPEPMSALARNAEERWNFAKKMDREFNHNIYRASEPCAPEKKKPQGLSETPKQSREPKKETPQERLKRKLRQQLNKQIQTDKEEEKKKLGEKEKQRRDQLRLATTTPGTKHKREGPNPAVTDLSRNSGRSRSRSRSRGGNRHGRRYTPNRSSSRSLSRSPSRTRNQRKRRSRSRSRGCDKNSPKKKETELSSGVVM